MDIKVINGIKNLSLDMINEANSGHPGICLGAAPILYTLFSRHLVFNPNDGNWINRDRFVMSSGHGSALLYSTLFFAGYPIKIEDLKTFRKLGSQCTGHPELNSNIGVEATTGPLGQGFANAVGFAIAEEYLGNNLNREIFNHYTYCMVSDGDLMEGISYEACSLAGSLKLGKLIVLYDSNDICSDGKTNNTFDENVLKRFDACGWHTEYVKDGQDIDSIDEAIKKSKQVKDKPSIIQIKTVIGFGSVNQNTSAVHKNPLSEYDLDTLKDKWGVNKIPFYVSKEAVEYFRDKINSRNNSVYESWKLKYSDFMAEEGVLQKTLKYMENNDFHIDLKKLKINVEEKYNEELRSANGKIINMLSKMCPVLVSGSADLFESTKTYILNGKDFSPSISGRNIQFGVREHLMAGVLNGLSLSGLRPIGSTFLAFSDYMKASIRLSALMNIPVTYVFTHDSIFIGEDGPTHQPVEQLASLRTIPNMTIFRPCDIKEIVGCWDYIINNKKPVCLVISKDKFPPIESSNIESIYSGAYIIKKERNILSGILIASGSDVHRAIEVSDFFEKKAIYLRVVSVPSLEIFKNQSIEYKNEIFPNGVKTIVIESSNDFAWLEYVYNNNYIININEFGKSGNKKELTELYGFDQKSLIEKVEKLLM